MSVDTFNHRQSAPNGAEHVAECLSSDAILNLQKTHCGTTEKIILIGASTGGTEAIKVVLSNLPLNSPAILITQHMPHTFTHSFASRLNDVCQITVVEACAGMRVSPGHAYISPGHAHLLLAHAHHGYVCALNDGPPVNRHRPSVDVLFRSAANCAGQNAIGIILTGMGKDGARGMLEMHQAGAYTLAQDEASCVVYGMPKEAIALRGVNEIVALQDVVARLFKRLNHQISKT